MLLIRKNVTSVYCHNTRIACVWLLWEVYSKCVKVIAHGCCRHEEKCDVTKSKCEILSSHIQVWDGMPCGFK